MRTIAKCSSEIHLGRYAKSETTASDTIKHRQECMTHIKQYLIDRNRQQNAEFVKPKKM